MDKIEDQIIKANEKIYMSESLQNLLTIENEKKLCIEFEGINNLYNMLSFINKKNKLCFTILIDNKDKNLNKIVDSKYEYFIFNNKDYYLKNLKLIKIKIKQKNKNEYLIKKVFERR